MHPLPVGETGGASGKRLRGEPAARSEAKEAGRKALRSAPGAEPQGLRNEINNLRTDTLLGSMGYVGGISEP